MVANIAFCGMGMFSSKEIRCGESLMYEGVLGTKGLIYGVLGRTYELWGLTAFDVDG